MLCYSFRFFCLKILSAPEHTGAQWPTTCFFAIVKRLYNMACSRTLWLYKIKQGIFKKYVKYELGTRQFLWNSWNFLRHSWVDPTMKSYLYYCVNEPLSVHQYLSDAPCIYLTGFSKLFHAINKRNRARAQA